VKRLASGFIGIVLAVVFFGVALADDFIIPVNVGGEVIDVTVTVEGGKVITATAESDMPFDLSVGDILQLKASDVYTGTFSDLLDIDPDDHLASYDEFRGISFYNSDPSIQSFLVIESLETVQYAVLVPYVGKFDGEPAYMRLIAYVMNHGKMSGDIRMNLLIDGERFWFDIDESEIEYDSSLTDIGSTLYTAAIDMSADQEIVEIMQAIAMADSVKIQAITDNSQFISNKLNDVAMDHIKTSVVLHDMLGGNIGE